MSRRVYARTVYFRKYPSCYSKAKQRIEKSYMQLVKVTPLTIRSKVVEIDATYFFASNYISFISQEWQNGEIYKNSSDRTLRGFVIFSFIVIPRKSRNCRELWFRERYHPFQSAERALSNFTRKDWRSIFPTSESRLLVPPPRLSLFFLRCFVATPGNCCFSGVDL